MFDSSFARNAPSSFPLDRVIKGWGEGVQLMVAGEKRRFWIPQEIAYNGMAGRPAGMLVFDIELLDLQSDRRARRHPMWRRRRRREAHRIGSRLQVAARRARAARIPREAAP